MELDGKKVTVVGAARSGLAAGRFLCTRGAEVLITDQKTEEELGGTIGPLRRYPICWELGGHSVKPFLEADLIVVSPGVPLDIDPLALANDKGIPIISEIELASKFIHAPIIAITGTNGKTTTTGLIGQILSQWGKNVFIGGNIGKPLIECITEGEDPEYVVVEVSSFQLEGIRDFRPHIGLLLNLCEDHLDRYLSYEDYVSAKARIFMNQGPGDYAILNADDLGVMDLARDLPSRVFTFGFKKDLSSGAFIEDHQKIIFMSFGEVKDRISLEGIDLKGRHNRQNIMAATVAAKLYGCPGRVIQEALGKMKGFEHRMEYVATFKGISFYNDSKATNVGAVVESIKSFEEPVVLISGGKDKGIDYKGLRDPIKKHVKLVILIGEARQRMARALASTAPIVMASSMAEALERALLCAERKDVVLLSPACSSFDMYKDYEERGEDFKGLVFELIMRGE